MQQVDQNVMEKQKPEGKNQYQTPGFVEYGSVISLTRNSQMGSCPDADGRDNMQCNDNNKM